MGNDNKTVRGKIINLTVLCETYGLFYITLVAPSWLSAQAVQCIENQLQLQSVLWTKATVNLPSNGFVVITN